MSKQGTPFQSALGERAQLQKADDFNMKPKKKKKRKTSNFGYKN